MLSFAGIIKGKVTDFKIGKPLIGATVQLEKGGKKYTTTVNLDNEVILTFVFSVDTKN